MGGIVNLSQVLEVEVRIYLGRGNIGVAKQLLYRPEITTGFQYMTGAGMPQHMRVEPSRKAAFGSP